MTDRVYLTISGVFFSLVFLLHLFRLLFNWEIQVASWHPPIGFSWGGLVVGGVLAVWGFYLASRK